jgi:hypothetical protein
MTTAYDLCRDQIADMLDERFYPLEWLDQQIATGAIRTLANDGGFIGYEIKEYPSGAREAHGMFAVGDLDAVLELIDQVEFYARSQGFIALTIASRAGWAKALKSRGFEPHQLTIMKELI